MNDVMTGGAGLTVTAVLAVTDPPVLVAVSVKLMLWLGVTTIEDFPVTSPTPEIKTDEAPV